MNNRQLDMVLGYLNEGIEINKEEYINEGISERIINKEIQKKAANAVNSYIATEGFGYCLFIPTYSAFDTGLFNRSKKSKNFTKGNGKEFVLTAEPRMSGYSTGSGLGSGSGYGSASAYGSDSYYNSDAYYNSYTTNYSVTTNYSLDGVIKIGKFLKNNIAEINKVVSRAIGPCKVKVGDLYHDNQYITLVVTMK